MEESDHKKYWAKCQRKPSIFIGTTEIRERESLYLYVYTEEYTYVLADKIQHLKHEI